MANKLIKRAAAFIAAAAVMLVPTANSIPEKSTVSAAPDAYHDDWLHVNDKAQIVDMNGNEVWMTGVNWFGYNVGSQIFDGAWSVNVHHCLDLIADHGFNLLRVPMSTEILLQWKAGKPDPIIKLNEYEYIRVVLRSCISFLQSMCCPRFCKFFCVFFVCFFSILQFLF